MKKKIDISVSFVLLLLVAVNTALLLSNKNLNRDEYKLITTNTSKEYFDKDEDYKRISKYLKLLKNCDFYYQIDRKPMIEDDLTPTDPLDHFKFENERYVSVTKNLREKVLTKFSYQQKDIILSSLKNNKFYSRVPNPWDMAFRYKDMMVRFGEIIIYIFSSDKLVACWSVTMSPYGDTREYMKPEFYKQARNISDKQKKDILYLLAHAELPKSSSAYYKYEYYSAGTIYAIYKDSLILRFFVSKSDDASKAYCINTPFAGVMSLSSDKNLFIYTAYEYPDAAYKTIDSIINTANHE